MTHHEGTKAQRNFAPIPASQDELGQQIVDSAFQVHKTLGPGLLENIYEEGLCCELNDRHIHFEQQKPVSVRYKGQDLSSQYRLDLLIDNQVIVEIKCTDKLMPVHDAQILTYLKLTKLRLGYLINFNVPLIKNGIRRRVL